MIVSWLTARNSLLRRLVEVDEPTRGRSAPRHRVDVGDRYTREQQLVERLMVLDRPPARPSVTADSHHALYRTPGSCGLIRATADRRRSQQHHIGPTRRARRPGARARARLPRTRSQPALLRAIRASAARQVSSSLDTKSTALRCYAPASSATAPRTSSGRSSGTRISPEMSFGRRASLIAASVADSCSAASARSMSAAITKLKASRQFLGRKRRFECKHGVSREAQPRMVAGMHTSRSVSGTRWSAAQDRARVGSARITLGHSHSRHVVREDSVRCPDGTAGAVQERAAAALDQCPWQEGSRLVDSMAIRRNSPT